MAIVKPPFDWFSDNPPPATPPQTSTSDPRYPNAVVDDGQGGRDNAQYQALWASSGHNVQQYINSVIAAKGLKAKQSDQASWNPIIAALEAVGQPATLDVRSDGMHKGIYLGGDPKNFVKMLDGNDNWIWDTSGGAGTKTTSLDPNTVGSLLAPFPGSFASAAGSAPQLDQAAFSYPDFQMPTGDQVLASDPGYLFRASQGEKALLANRAMRGTLDSGGTAKDIVDYNQNAASQEFANFFDRSLSTYKTNYGTAKDVSTMGNDRRTALYNSQYKNYLDQYNMFRQRQQDTNQYLTAQQDIGIRANA